MRDFPSRVLLLVVLLIACGERVRKRPVMLPRLRRKNHRRA